MVDYVIVFVCLVVCLDRHSNQAHKHILACMPVERDISVSVCLITCLHIWLSFVSLFVCLVVCLHVLLSVHLFVWLYVCMYACLWSIELSDVFP